jgi:hypothetical protein
MMLDRFMRQGRQIFISLGFPGQHCPTGLSIQQSKALSGQFRTLIVAKPAAQRLEPVGQGFDAVGHARLTPSGS